MEVVSLTSAEEFKIEESCANGSRVVVLWVAPGQHLPARCSEPGFFHCTEAMQARWCERKASRCGEGKSKASPLLV